MKSKFSILGEQIHFIYSVLINESPKRVDIIKAHEILKGVEQNIIDDEAYSLIEDTEVKEVEVKEVKK